MIFFNFNPRSPWGERHWISNLYPEVIGFQSTLPVGGATRAGAAFFCPGWISIHAPRGGSDHTFSGWSTAPGDFNPRSPWGERRWHAIPLTRQADFNPRSPWGERLHGLVRKPCRCGISIHAPRGGSDCFGRFCAAQGQHFNPRSPWGERPPEHRTKHIVVSISIHAPRGGSDFGLHTAEGGTPYFNPRSPWGERP